MVKSAQKAVASEWRALTDVPTSLVIQVRKPAVSKPPIERLDTARKSEVSKGGWPEGAGDKQTPKNRPKNSPGMRPLLLGGHRIKGAENGLDFWHRKDFFAPTPSVR